MGKVEQINREELKRALEREIDELVQAKIKADADRQIEELKASRVRGGLPRVADPNLIQIYLQRLVGLFKFRERERVFDIVRESVCHELLRKASWAVGNEPANEEYKARLELISDITVAVEERVLHIQKKGFLEKVELFDKKSEKARKRAVLAKSVLKRMEIKVEVYEEIVQEIAESRGWAVGEKDVTAFAEQPFELLEKQISELEKLGLESEKLLAGLPEVDFEDLKVDQLKELLTAVEDAAEYFGLACAVTSEALDKIAESKAKSTKRIAVWQERQKISHEKADKEAVELCREYIGAQQRYLDHYEKLAETVGGYLREHQGKQARMERARDVVQKKLARKAA